MNRTRRLALLLVTLVTLGLTACGSSGSSGKLSKADLIAKGDKICRQARNKGAKLPKVHSYAGFKQLGPAAAKIIDDTLSKQKGLIPPASVKSDYDAYLDNVAKQSELAHKLGDAAKIGNRQGITKVKKLLTEASRNVAKGRSLARKVGFKLCGNALGR